MKEEVKTKLNEFKKSIQNKQLIREILIKNPTFSDHNLKLFDTNELLLINNNDKKVEYYYSAFTIKKRYPFEGMNLILIHLLNNDNLEICRMFVYLLEHPNFKNLEPSRFKAIVNAIAQAPSYIIAHEILHFGIRGIGYEITEMQKSLNLIARCNSLFRCDKVEYLIMGGSLKPNETKIWNILFTIESDENFKRITDILSANGQKDIPSLLSNIENAKDEKERTLILDKYIENEQKTILNNVIPINFRRN